MPDESNETKNPNRFKFSSYQPNGGDGWLKWVQRAGIALLVVVAVVLLARTIHHHYETKNPAPQVTVTTTTQPTGATTHKVTVKKHSTKKSTSSSDVPNTGPGDTVAMFLGISLLAAGGHAVWSARRQAKA